MDTAAAVGMNGRTPSDGLLGPPSAQLVKPPLSALVVGGGGALLSVMLHVFDPRWVSWTGYLLGSFVTILAVAFYRREDTARSSGPWYSPQPNQRFIAMAVLVVGIASAAGHVWSLAQRIPASQ